MKKIEKRTPPSTFLEPPIKRNADPLPRLRVLALRVRDVRGEGGEDAHFAGYLARGILLQAIRHVDPAASQALHEPNIRKAYAVTPLWFRKRGRLPDGYILDPAYPCRMGVKFLADEYAKLLLKSKAPLYGD